MPAISTTLGESSAAVALRAAPSKIMATGKSGAREYASTLARLYSVPTAGMRPVGSRAAILEEHLGKTFIRNASTLEYEVSDRTGAPSNGVRFIVYTVNPISGQPVTPLQEVGYADVEVTQTTNSASIRIELVSGNVTYLDYTVGATASQTAATINVSGFVSNGEDRVNFDLDMHLNSVDSVSVLVAPEHELHRLDWLARFQEREPSHDQDRRACWHLQQLHLLTFCDCGFEGLLTPPELKPHVFSNKL